MHLSGSLQQIATYSYLRKYLIIKFISPVSAVAFDGRRQVSILYTVLKNNQHLLNSALPDPRTHHDRVTRFVLPHIDLASNLMMVCSIQFYRRFLPSQESCGIGYPMKLYFIETIQHLGFV